MKLARNKQRKGFTLIEILVVIAIMSALGAIAWVAYGAIESRKQNNTTQQHVDMLATCLTDYFSNAKAQDPILWADGGEEGAVALYKMLSGDFDCDGKTDKGRTAYCKQLVHNDPNDTTKQEGIPFHSIGKNKYAIVDAWGRPISYRLGYGKDGTKNTKAGSSTRNKAKETEKGTGINADFDIYSLGEDGLGNGRTNKDENEDNISNIKFL